MQNEIIAKLYTEKRFRDITKNVCNDYCFNFKEDLHSEIVLKIIEVGDDVSEIKDSELHYYFTAFAVRTIKYNYQISKKYGFNQNRPDSPYEFIDEIEYTEDDFNQSKTDKFYEKKDEILSDHENDTWRDKYERELFKLYLKHRSYREVQEAVDIPFRSVADALKSFIEKIKKQL